MDSSDPHGKPHQVQNLQQQQPVMSPETERIIARFILDPSREGFHEITKNSEEPGTDFMASPPMMYQGASLPPVPDQSSKSISSGPEMHDGTAAQGKMGSPNNSDLFWHSSSPAGLFYDLNPESGMRNFGSISGSEGEANFAPLSNMEGSIDFPSHTIPENGGHPGNDCILTGIPIGSSEEIEGFTENFSNLISAGEDDVKILSDLNVHETQGGVPFQSPPPGLSFHMGLPKTAAEVSSMEKTVKFRDSVRGKIRAKPGCATHPRSIAERMRRSRISERMRKLQELVPNMDEKTSTAVLLDFTVDYIIGLQNQVRTLSE